MNQARPAETDVFVIGGGPAGSTISTLLAEAGHRVVMAEKSAHPRFHIGESLLPMNGPIFDRLGVSERVAEIGVRKNAADFTPVGEDGEWGSFRFDRALGDGPDHAWQVNRAELDQLLFQRAADAGTHTIEHCEVIDVDPLGTDGQQVDVRLANGEERRWHARFVVDASGRDTFMARRNGWKSRDPSHASASVYGHFEGVQRREGEDTGNISIYWLPQGWLWMIPLPGDTMSIGAVCPPAWFKTRGRRDLDRFLTDTIALSPAAQARMKRARPTRAAEATGNYSYRSSQSSGDGYLLLGDAYAFVDPVFSSGVYLAMAGAERAVAPIQAWLSGERRAWRRERRRWARDVERGMGTFNWFIHRFSTPAMRWLFANPRNHLQVEQAVISMLAGDVYDNAPVRRRLAVFRGLHGAISLARWGTTRRVMRDDAESVRNEFA